MKNCPLCLSISVILGKTLILFMSCMSLCASMAFQLSRDLTRFMRTPCAATRLKAEQMEHSGDLESLQKHSYLSSMLSVQIYYYCVLTLKNTPKQQTPTIACLSLLNIGMLRKDISLYCERQNSSYLCRIDVSNESQAQSMKVFKSLFIFMLVEQFEFAGNFSQCTNALLQFPVSVSEVFRNLVPAQRLAKEVADAEENSNADDDTFHVCNNNNTMLSIAMEQFITWFQTKMDGKYAMKMESLKRSLMFFYNLADQVVSLYHAMRQKVEKYSDKEEYKDIVGLLNRSLIIIAKITDRIPTCLDSHFCQKFIKAFDFNINLLCTYYHSLSHFELLKKESIPEKDKIVEGINKMYTIHLKIKDIYKHNLEIIQTLTLISEYKRIFNNKINSITNKLKIRREARDYFSDNFEAQAIEFYEGLLEKTKALNEQPQAKKSLMRVYFQLVQQQISTQARLQQLLENCMRVCGQIRSKKKNISFIGMESSNQLARWVNIILKPSISLKNLKKLKVEEFMKAITTVLQEKETFNYFYMQYFENSQEEIQALANLIIDIAKELEKIQQAGLLTLIAEYRDTIVPNGSKKFINRLIDYHTEMSRFYSLHEQIKQLQRFVQTIVLEELGLKVNIVIDQGEEEQKVEEPPGKLRSE